MSAYRTMSNTPETVRLVEYNKFDKDKKQETLSKWLNRYNTMNNTRHTITNCPKYVKQLYKIIPYHKL